MFSACREIPKTILPNSQTQLHMEHGQFEANGLTNLYLDTWLQRFIFSLW